MARTRKIGNDDRLAQRLPVFVTARCRESSWVMRQVELADISAGGCRIVRDAGGLAIGQQIELRIASSKGVDGHVRWLRDGDAGVDFAQAADPEARAELAQTYSPAGNNVTDIRRFKSEG